MSSQSKINPIIIKPKIISTLVTSITPKIITTPKPIGITPIIPKTIGITKKENNIVNNYSVDADIKYINDCESLLLGHTFSSDNIPDYMVEWLKLLIDDTIRKEQFFLDKISLSGKETIVPVLFELYNNLLLSIINISDFKRIDKRGKYTPEQWKITNFRRILGRIQSTVYDKLNIASNKLTETQENIRNAILLIWLMAINDKSKARLSKEPANLLEQPNIYIMEFLRINKLSDDWQIAIYITGVLQIIIRQIVKTAYNKKEGKKETDNTFLSPRNINKVLSLYPCDIIIAIHSDSYLKDVFKDYLTDLVNDFNIALKSGIGKSNLLNPLIDVIGHYLK